MQVRASKKIYHVFHRMTEERVGIALYVGLGIQPLAACFMHLSLYQLTPNDRVDAGTRDNVIKTMKTLGRLSLGQ